MQSSCTNPSLEARSGYAEEESQGLSRTKNLNSPVSDDMDLQDDEGSRKNLFTRANITLLLIIYHCNLRLLNEFTFQVQMKILARANISKEKTNKDIVFL